MALLVWCSLISWMFLLTAFCVKDSWTRCNASWQRWGSPRLTSTCSFSWLEILSRTEHSDRETINKHRAGVDPTAFFMFIISYTRAFMLVTCYNNNNNNNNSKLVVKKMTVSFNTWRNVTFTLNYNNYVVCEVFVYFLPLLITFI